MRILGLREDCQASAWWRCWNWLEEFERHGHLTKSIGTKCPLTAEKTLDLNPLEEMCGWADVVLTTSKFFSPWIVDDLLAFREKHGFRLVVDHDDPVWMLPAESRNPARRLLSEADLTVVASETMRRECEGEPKRFLVVSNLVNVRLFQDERHEGDAVTVVFAGGYGHVPDFDYLRPVIERLRTTHPHVNVECINAAPAWAIDAGIAKPQNYDYTEHLRYLGFLRPAIALVPLVSEYRTKLITLTKYLDYTMCGIPGVYQADHPAYSSVQHRVTGMKATTHDEWYDAIVALVEDRSLAREIAANAKNDVIANLTTSEYADEYLTALEALTRGRECAA